MQISAIRFSNFSNQQKAITKNNNNNSQYNATNRVSFGYVPATPPVPVDPLTMLIVMAIEALGIGGTMMGIDAYNEMKDRRAQLSHFRTLFKEHINDDIQRYKNAYRCSDEQARSIYMKRFKKCIVSNDNRNFSCMGLHRVNGHVFERFQLLTSVVMPLLDSKKDTTARKLIPNGVLLYGENTQESEVLLDAFKNHIHELGLPVKTVDLGATNDVQRHINVGRLQNMFEQAEEDYYKNGEHTLIHIKNIDALNADNTPYELDLLKNYMENSVSRGAIVVFDTQDPKNIDKALLRPGRCDVKIAVEQPVEETPIEEVPVDEQSKLEQLENPAEIV